MSYKIAVGSSDGINVDLKFGEVNKFIIYEAEDEKSRVSEYRNADIHKTIIDTNAYVTSSGECNVKACNSSACHGNGNGCNGASDIMDKVELISDCRCVVCKKIGFQAQKQLERKAISVFDIEGKIDEILQKIIAYYGKLDRHRKK